MNGSERAAGATRAGVTETVVRLPHGLVLPAGVEEVVVRRSTRRRRSVAARRDGRRIIVMVPARMSRAEETRWVRDVVGRIAGAARRGASAAGDEELMARAAGLRRTYVPEAPEPASVRWVSNQRSRWGSCTSAERTIRLSDRLRAMPDWVIDAVLVHELAHLVHCDHGPAFRRIERRYELAEKASGFLEGWEAGAAFVGQGG
ncbi:M48 family metallopeptidase [uncultured Propionibacterium sp.]|uniref:M48 metallopeptidase family protein n=1 Tax=uncultured Propionibacterium sp. TaxID=218066 RepID=UPI00292EE7DD|nr:M48 family metallopeptidase [uncultured Propionibacterium sp.]